MLHRIATFQLSLLLLSLTFQQGTAYPSFFTQYRSSFTTLKMSTSDSPSNKLDIIIAGAGIIGTSTAYYLARNHANHVNSITIVDPTGSIAPAASGKAGGFLALDWNDYSPVGPLARRSFDLHQEIAEEFGHERIQYRRLKCASISVDESNQKKPKGKKLEGVEWASDTMSASGGISELAGSYITGIRPLGDEQTIAQVHPKMLCDALWSFVQSVDSISSRIVKGSISLGRTKYNENNSGTRKRVTATLQDGKELQANAVLFACGPWTEYMDCVFGVKYHSAVIPTRPRVLTQSVFFDGFGDPEVYPRPDGTAYCCGYPDPPTKVTEKPGEEEVRPEKIEEIVRGVRQCSGGKDGMLGNDPEISQSCYLPSTPDNLPMMGALDDKKGLFCATGHSCWGILMGPATGEAMASLMIQGRSSLDLSPFLPQRFSK